MEMRGQGGERQGTARGASKSPAGKKQGEQNQGASMNQGGSQDQGTTGNQGTSGSQGTQPGAGQQAGGEQDLLQHAKHATGEIMNKVQEQAGTQVTRQKETAATQLSQVANAVRRLRDNLPEEQAGYIGNLVSEYGDKAANNLERLSTYIREQDPKQLLNDVQNFGRRQPALLLGGAFLLGFAGARLIRSSMSTTGSQYGSRQMNVPKTTFTPQNVSASRQSITPGAV